MVGLPAEESNDTKQCRNDEDSVNNGNGLLHKIYYTVNRGLVVNIRNRALPEGWYPSSEGEIRELLSEWKPKFHSRVGLRDIIAGIVPHAGWVFCGSIIADVLSSFQKNLETIIVLGGHNSPGGPVIEYSEDCWSLPSGDLSRDKGLSERIKVNLPEDISMVGERSVDNTVEVIMPLIAVMYPDVKWAAWRLPSDKSSIEFGKILASTVKETGKRVAVIGSTDLTHYGANYGFTPRESLKSPVTWVKERDSRILRALAELEGKKALELAVEEHSACSAGAAVGAMTFARSLGCSNGQILNYSTSRDVHPSSSFVGYGSIIWESV